jgi:hypothetical protein
MGDAILFEDVNTARVGGQQLLIEKSGGNF